MYSANYIDGLRIVDITKIDYPGDEFLPQTPAAPDHHGLYEVACFDTDPFRNDMGVFPDGRTAWGASWSNYPYFKSGVVVVSGLDGLFLVKPRLGVPAASPPATGENPPSGTPAATARTSACLPEIGGPTGSPGDPCPRAPRSEARSAIRDSSSSRRGRASFEIRTIVGAVQADELKFERGRDRGGVVADARLAVKVRKVCF
jgi:hypothetical protein